MPKPRSDFLIHYEHWTEAEKELFKKVIENYTKEAT